MTKFPGRSQQHPAGSLVVAPLTSPGPVLSMALETQQCWTDKDVLRKINSWWRKLTIYLHKEVKHLLSCSVGGLTTLCFSALVYTNLYNLIYVARLSWCIIRSGSCD